MKLELCGVAIFADHVRDGPLSADGSLLDHVSDGMRFDVRGRCCRDWLRGRRDARLLQHPQAVELAGRLDDPGQHQAANNLVPAGRVLEAEGPVGTSATLRAQTSAQICFREDEYGRPALCDAAQARIFGPGQVA